MSQQLPAQLPQAPAATPPIFVFYEDGFPASDSAAPTRGALASALPNAQIAGLDQLKNSLADPRTQLLVLPYGSSFPEPAWPEIQAFLQRGGNLLVIGGKPFLRAAYRQNRAWRLRDESVRFTRPLLINDYWETPPSSGLDFVRNADIPLDLPQFSWKRAFSPIVRLSVKDMYPREGSAGSIDARLDTLAWGGQANAHLAAPIIAIDHLQYTYAGGRWVLLACELPQDFFQSEAGQKLIAVLAEHALYGAEQLTLRPTVALFLPGEEIRLRLDAQTFRPAQDAKVEIAVTAEKDSGHRPPVIVTLPQAGELVLPPVPSKGFHHIEARFYQGEHLHRIYHSAFWIRDEDYLRSGQRLSVNSDFFELDGKPMPVVGTTYMSSEVQRQFLDQPNAFVWDQDLMQISANGLNMIRTGWWTGWDKALDEQGQPKEAAMRNVEALLMTARRHGLPVQLTFFAFLPEVLGGDNGYLDPVAVQRQRTFIFSVVQRFKDVPFLAYDLINEPSFSKHTWETRPNGDRVELEAWNKWLLKKYPDESSLYEAWNLAPSASPLPVPVREEFAMRGAYTGRNTLKVHDYYLFSQEGFADWARQLQQTIRSTGSQQLITVGQDDGGYAERLNPAYFSGLFDFTTNHTWWLNNELLWCSLIAKQPGKPMLIQETGLQRELTLAERQRRTTDSEAALFERKLATSFVQGTGALEWLWNVNPYMTSDNEAPIGAVRPDGTIKPEGTVLREMAKFIASVSQYFVKPEKPDVAIVTSQAMQYSVLNGMANRAQQRSVRALHYHSRIPGYIVAENRLSELGSPKLVILPSPQALNSHSWELLLQYVRDGGNLLVTGPVDRDEHWQRVERTSAFDPKAQVQPLTFSSASLRVGHKDVNFHFDLEAQNFLESLAFENEKGIKDVALGRGHMFWVAYPIELSEDLESVAAVYSNVAGPAKVSMPFRLAKPLGTGVLAYPEYFRDAALYIFTSESAVQEEVALKDHATGAKLNFQLPSQRAALVLIRRSDGKVLGHYGF